METHAIILESSISSIQQFLWEDFILTSAQL